MNKYQESQGDWHSWHPVIIKKLECTAQHKSTVLDEGFLKQMTVLTNKGMGIY